MGGDTEAGGGGQQDLGTMGWLFTRAWYVPRLYLLWRSAVYTSDMVMLKLL